MLIAKFGMVFLLAWMTMLVAMRIDRNAPLGGPYYYLASPGHPNPIQPGRRLNALQAYRAKAHLQVTFNDQSLPAIVRHVEGRREAWREVYVWDRLGRMRERLKLLPGGWVLSRERFRPAEDPSLHPNT